MKIKEGTQKSLLLFHCNNSYANASTILVMTVSVETVCRLTYAAGTADVRRLSCIRFVRMLHVPLYTVLGG